MQSLMDYPDSEHFDTSLVPCKGAEDERSRADRVLFHTHFFQNGYKKENY